MLNKLYLVAMQYLHLKRVGHGSYGISVVMRHFVPLLHKMAAKMF